MPILLFLLLLLPMLFVDADETDIANTSAIANATANGTDNGTKRYVILLSSLINHSTHIIISYQHLSCFLLMVDGLSLYADFDEKGEEGHDISFCHSEQFGIGPLWQSEAGI